MTRAKEGVYISGLVVPYNVPARIGENRHYTLFRPGAFDAAIRTGRVPLCVNHRKASLVASQFNGTLTLVSLNHSWHRGVFLSAMVTGPWADVVLEADRHEKLHGVSVYLGDLRSAHWTSRAREMQIVEDAGLDEVSLCIEPTHPAFSTTWARVVADMRTPTAVRRAA